MHTLTTKQTESYANSGCLSGFNNLEWLNANFKQQKFSKHIHQSYCISLVQSGGQCFRAGEKDHLAPAGDIILINAEQAHDGHSATPAGWSYSAIYPMPEVISNISIELSNGKINQPWFKNSVVNDPRLKQALKVLFDNIKQDNSSLSLEANFLNAITILILNHGDNAYSLPKLGNEHRAVKQAIDIIDATFTEQISIEVLAKQVALNPLYFTRVFHQKIGIPPHAFIIQRRIHQAKMLIQTGMAISDVALSCGFVDQSHLSRHFKNSLGLTPGQYAKIR